MKKFLMLFASVAFALVACEPETVPEDNGGGDDSGKTNPPVEEKVDFKISSDLVVNLGAESAIYTLKFTAPEAWTVSVDYPGAEKGFVVLSKESGDKGENEVKVTVQSLPEEEMGRYFFVNLKCGSNAGKITVYQGQVFIVSDDWFEVGKSGGKAEFTIVSNLEYEVTLYDDAFPWANPKFDKATGKGSFEAAASDVYDARTAYMKFVVPSLNDFVVRIYFSQEGNLQIGWVQQFFWGMFPLGTRESIAELGDYFIINCGITEVETGGAYVFKKSDGSCLGVIPGLPSLTGVTNDDAGNIILSAGGNYPIDETTWSLIPEQQVPLTVFALSKEQALSVLGGGEIPKLSPIIAWYNTCYGYGVDNIRVTGDIFGKAVVDVVSAAYQEEEPQSRVAAWQITGGKAAAEPVIRTVPSDMSIWTPTQLVAKHLTNEVEGPLYYMGYDANYQLWIADNMSADWQSVLDSGCTWEEGFSTFSTIEWNGHKYLSFVGVPYFAWADWDYDGTVDDHLPGHLWLVNIDNPKEPVVVSKYEYWCNQENWQYGDSADVKLVIEGNDLVAYMVDAASSQYMKVIYPKL
jgi:hypothetical protein